MDLTAQRSQIKKENEHFVENLYKGRSKLEDQVTLEKRLQEFDFIEDSDGQQEDARQSEQIA